MIRIGTGTGFFGLPVFFFLLIFMQNLQGQPDSTPTGLVVGKVRVQPVIGLQMWGTYTMGEEVYHEQAGTFERVDDRLNFQLRRTRAGVRGQVMDNLKFELIASLDLVGRDVYSGTDAGSNNGPSPVFRIWNAYLHWQPVTGNETFNLVAGYFVPQVGRESVNSALVVPSMEKAWSQNYLRMHLAGTGPGRLPGLHIGGLLNGQSSVAWGYDVGIFSTTYQTSLNLTSGVKSAPLLTGRLGLYFGEKEITTYHIGRIIDPFDQRFGASIGLAAAYQGNTDLFRNSTTLSLDAFWSFGPLNVDGDWSFLSRRGALPGEVSGAATGYLRAAYAFALQSGRALEPSVMVMVFKGEDEADAQLDAGLLGMASGSEHSIDIGVNYYITSKVKVSLHYTFRGANSGMLGDASAANNFYHQPGIGAIHRGDWAGLGVVIRL